MCASDKLHVTWNCMDWPIENNASQLNSNEGAVWHAHKIFVTIKICIGHLYRVSGPRFSCQHHLIIGAIRVEKRYKNQLKIKSLRTDFLHSTCKYFQSSCLNRFDFLINQFQIQFGEKDISWHCCIVIHGRGPGDSCRYPGSVCFDRVRVSGRTANTMWPIISDKVTSV